MLVFCCCSCSTHTDGLWRYVNELIQMLAISGSIDSEKKNLHWIHFKMVYNYITLQNKLPPWNQTYKTSISRGCLVCDASKGIWLRTMLNPLLKLLMLLLPPPSPHPSLLLRNQLRSPMRRRNDKNWFFFPRMCTNSWIPL